MKDVFKTFYLLPIVILILSGCSLINQKINQFDSNSSNLSESEYIVEDLPTPTPDNRPTTPELIQADFENGAITLEEKLVYLSYAASPEADQVPEKYEGSGQWDDTPYMTEIEAAINDTDVFCDFSQESREILTRYYPEEDVPECNI